MDTLPNGYVICRAEERHVPFLNDIETAAASIFPAGVLPAYMALDTVPAPVLREAMEDARLWVAVGMGGEPIGYALWEMLEGAALLAQIDVHPGYGRKGVGAALVGRVIDDVGKRGALALYLTTFASVRWNAPFYAKQGFVKLSEGEEPECIRDILAQERQNGLKDRVAMRYVFLEGGDL